MEVLERGAYLQPERKKNSKKTGEAKGGPFLPQKQRPEKFTRGEITPRDRNKAGGENAEMRRQGIVVCRPGQRCSKLGEAKDGKKTIKKRYTPGAEVPD